MEDYEIVDLYLKRDEQAISQSQLKYGHYCYSIAYRILYSNEDSQECVNDTFLGAWNSIPPHKPKNLSTYLGKITRRLALYVWRNTHAQKRGGQEVTCSFEELEAIIPAPERMEAEELTEILNDFLKRLSSDQRKVFVCRYWYFESIEEISKRFRFSQSKVKMILKRTRDVLAKRLKEEGVYYEG
ncbi:MAG: RNA polymerase sigma factor [Bacillota bacterium]|nr:RNA polymerase sigma factor [Bacillota bacterium]